MVQGSSENYGKSDDQRRYADPLNRRLDDDSNRIDRDDFDDDERRASREIREEIERTRANMDRTVDALQERLDPQLLVHRAFDGIRENAGDVTQQALHVVKRNIVPSALIAAGLAWLIVNESRASTRSSKSYRSASHRKSFGLSEHSLDDVEPCDEFGRPVNKPVSQTSGLSGPSGSSGSSGVPKSPTGASVSSRISMGMIGDFGCGCGPEGYEEEEQHHHKRGALKKIRSQAMHRMQDMRGYVGERASDVGHQIQYGANRAKDWFEQVVDEYPVAVGAGFFAIGLIAGFAIPATRPEHRYIGKYRDKLVRQAEEYGSELIDKGQEVAHKAVAAVQESVGSGTGGSGSDEPGRQPGQRERGNRT